MLRRLAWFPLLISILNVYSQSSEKRFDLKQIDGYIQQLMSEWKIAGCAVGIIYRDSLLFSKGYGYRDVQKKLPVTPKTLFAIGSNTKLFTSIAAATLHVERQLDLDKPVRTYMPQLNFASAELDEKLTIRDMLSHRSGVPRWDGVWFGASYSEDELLAKLKYLLPARGFRESLLYNNHYYFLAGLVCGKVLGSNYETLITEKLLAPLDMFQTSMTLHQLPKNSEWGNDYLLDHQTNDPVALTNADYFCRCLGPAGLMVSNVEDLSHWVITLLNKGVYRKKEVIPPAAIEETTRPVNSGFGRYRYSEIVDAGYGLGRNISFYKGHYFLYHGGSAGGYRTEISFFPNDSLAVIVLTNTLQGQYMAAAAVLGIADRLLNLDQTDWSERHMLELKRQISTNKRQLDSLRSLQVKNTKPSHSIGDYTGVYENKLYGTITIRIDSGQLILNFRNVDQTLEHFHYDQFWTRERANYSVYPQLYPIYRLHFYTDNRGAIYKFGTSIMNDPQTEFIKRLR